jgi:pilus assembly protein Flp/PilA
MRALRRLLTRDDGPTAVEYAVLLALIIASCIAAIGTVGNATSGIWASNNTKLQAAGF